MSFAQPQHPRGPRFQVRLLGIEDNGKVARIGWNIPSSAAGISNSDKPTWTFCVEWTAINQGGNQESSSSSSKDLPNSSDFAGTDSSNCRQTFLIHLDHALDVVRVRVSGRSTLLGDLTYRSVEVSDTMTITPGDWVGSTIDAVLRQNPEVLTTCFLAASSRPDAADFLPRTSALSPEFRENSLPPTPTIRVLGIGQMQTLWFELTVTLEEDEAATAEGLVALMERAQGLGSGKANTMEALFGADGTPKEEQERSATSRQVTVAIAIPCYERKNQGGGHGAVDPSAPTASNLSIPAAPASAPEPAIARQTSTVGAPASGAGNFPTSGGAAKGAGSSGTNTSSGFQGLKKVLSKRGIGSTPASPDRKLPGLSAPTGTATPGGSGEELPQDFGIELPPTTATYLLVCGYSTGNAGLAMKLAQTVHVTLQETMRRSQVAAKVAGQGQPVGYVDGSSRSLNDSMFGSTTASFGDTVSGGSSSIKEIAVISFAATPPASSFLDQFGNPSTIQTLHVFPLQQFTPSGREFTEARYLPFELDILGQSNLLAPLSFETIQDADAPDSENQEVADPAPMPLPPVSFARPVQPPSHIENFVAEGTDMSSHRILALVNATRPASSAVESCDPCRPIMLHAKLRFELNCSLVLVITGFNLRYVTGVSVHVTPGMEVDLTIEGRTMTKLVCRQSLLPFLTPPDDNPDSEGDKKSKRVELDWRKEWDVHVSIRSLVSFDSFHYGPVLFPQDVVGVLMHSSSKLGVEVLLSKAVLLQPVTTRLHAAGYVVTDPITKLLAELELTGDIVAATQLKHAGSSSTFSKLLHRAAAKVSTLATLSVTNLVQAEEHPKVDEHVMAKLKQWHQANIGAPVSPQVLLEWLVQPLKAILDSIPALRDKTYRHSILQLMRIFTAPDAGAASTTGGPGKGYTGEAEKIVEDTGASVGVLEYELHGYILRHLKTCNVNHATHDNAITQFTNFSVFYYHMSRKLLITKYVGAKATEAINLFQDAVTLWCVSLMHDFRRHLRSRHFVFVCGAPGSGVSTITSVLRQLCDDAPDGRGAGTVVADVPNTMSLAIALDSAFDATVVMVSTIGQDIKDALGNTYLHDIVPRVKQRRSQRCVVVRNKVDLHMVEKMQLEHDGMKDGAGRSDQQAGLWDKHMDTVLGTSTESLSPRSKGPNNSDKWESAALGHKYGSLEAHRHRKVEGQPVDVIALYTAVAPCPDAVVELSQYHGETSSEICRRLASLSADELRFGVLPHTVPPPPTEDE